MGIPRLVLERAIDTYSYVADATLLAQAYNTTKINGVGSTNVGLVPGALVKLTSGGKVALAGSAAGDATFMSPIGMLMSAPVPSYQDPSNTSGFTLTRAENDNVAVIPLSDAVVEIEAYLKQAEGSTSTLTYTAGELLYRSKYGFITKDPASQASPLGQVLEVLASGTLRVQLYRALAS